MRITLIGGGACSVDEALQTAAFSVLMGGVSESISINPSYPLSTTSGYFKNMAAQSIAQVGFNRIFRGLAGKPTTIGNIMADAISGVYSTQFQSLAIPKTTMGINFPLVCLTRQLLITLKGLRHSSKACLSCHNRTFLLS